MKIGPPTVTGEELRYWDSYRIERGIRDGELSLNQCWPDRTSRIVAAKMIDKAAADGKRILRSWNGGPWELIDYYHPFYGLEDLKIDPNQESNQ